MKKYEFIGNKEFFNRPYLSGEEKRIIEYLKQGYQPKNIAYFFNCYDKTIYYKIGRIKRLYQIFLHETKNSHTKKP